MFPDTRSEVWDVHGLHSNDICNMRFVSIYSVQAVSTHIIQLSIDS